MPLTFNGDLSQNLVKLTSYNYCFICYTISQNNADFYLTKSRFSRRNGHEYLCNPHAVLHTRPFRNSEFQTLNTVKLYTVNSDLANKLFQSSETQMIAFIFFLIAIKCDL